MKNCLGRLPFRAVAFLLLYLGGALLSLAPRVSHAQDYDEEVIEDPELMDEAPAPSDSDEEVIQDPELMDEPAISSEGAEDDEDDYGWGSVYQPPEAESTASTEEEEIDEYDPLANTGIGRIEVAAQGAFDLRQEDAQEQPFVHGLEDAYETRLRFGGEISLRRSRDLRLVMGSRVDFLWAVPSQNDVTLNAGESALDQDRFEVDIIPTAAYIDWTMFDGGHLRLGQQVLSMGRMDFVSGTDILAIYDGRPQAMMNPAAVRLPQPAVRFDWDITTAVTLQLAYVPWFSPNLTRPNRDKFVAAVTTGEGSANVSPTVAEVIDPSFQTVATGAAVRFVGPAPDFSTPQAQARLGFRMPGADIALTGGTALEKTPAVYYATEIEEVLLNCGPGVDCTDPHGRLALLGANEMPLVDVDFHRYYMIGADMGFNAGPLSISLEGAFSPERHLYAAARNETQESSRLPRPNTTQPIQAYPDWAAVPDARPGAPAEPVLDDNGEEIPPQPLPPITDPSIRKGVPVAQGGLHLEYLAGESLIVASELFWINALKRPHDRSREWLGFNPNLSAMYGGVFAVSYLVNNGQWRFDLSVMALYGPSFMAMPRVEYRITEGLFAQLGAQVIEGAEPGINGSTMLNVGGLYSGYDQVFFGFRWLP